MKKYTFFCDLLGVEVEEGTMQPIILPQTHKSPTEEQHYHPIGFNYVMMHRLCGVGEILSKLNEIHGDLFERLPDYVHNNFYPGKSLDLAVTCEFKECTGDKGEEGDKLNNNAVNVKVSLENMNINQALGDTIKFSYYFRHRYLHMKFELKVNTHDLSQGKEG